MPKRISVTIKYRRKLLICLMILALAGCAVGPDFQPPEPKAPEGWHSLAKPGPAQASLTTPRPVNLVDWWQAFNDPVLTSLMQMALSANLDLKLAEARIRQARATRGTVASGFYPAIDATAFYRRSKSGSGSLNPAGGGGQPSVGAVGGERSLFQIGLDAAWEIDIFGGVRRGIEAADADIRAAVEDRRDVLVTLAGEVGTNYLNLRGLQQEIAIARKNLESQKKTADITRRRFEAGYVSRLDLANADAQVATTESQIPRLESSAQAAIYTIGVLLGKEPAVLAKELAIHGPIPPNPPEVPVGLPSDILRRRPDIRRAEAQLHAATARIGVAVADLFPRFSLTGSFGASGSKLSLLDARGSFWSYGPSVTWPIFDAGRIRWNIKVQDALQEQALLTYEKTVLTALKDVETALVAHAKEQEQRKSLAEAVTNNRQAVDLSMKLYLVGKTDFLNVLNAQRSLFVTEVALAQSTRNLGANLVALYKALGGGWEKHETLIDPRVPQIFQKRLGN
ncbi:MAG: efflux transporter outer membrane subunit [Deltaproteobacteria bacterium]|nr:efflux transporter outer membrane subunit [Deltaproteobacteria bacterium]